MIGRANGKLMEGKRDLDGCVHGLNSISRFACFLSFVDVYLGLDIGVGNVSELKSLDYFAASFCVIALGSLDTTNVELRRRIRAWVEDLIRDGCVLRNDRVYRCDCCAQVQSASELKHSIPKVDTHLLDCRDFSINYGQCLSKTRIESSLRMGARTSLPLSSRLRRRAAGQRHMCRQQFLKDYL